MPRTFTDKEKLLILEHRIKSPLTQEEFIRHAAELFECDTADIKLNEWSENLDISSINGWQDKAIRALGGIGAGVGFGVPGFSAAAFIYCAVNGIPFSLAATSYWVMALGFLAGFLIGLPVGWRTTTPIVAKLSNLGQSFSNYLRGENVDLAQVERDLEAAYANSPDQTYEHLKQDLQRLQKELDKEKTISESQRKQIEELIKSTTALALAQERVTTTLGVKTNTSNSSVIEIEQAFFSNSAARRNRTSANASEQTPLIGQSDNNKPSTSYK